MRISGVVLLFLAVGHVLIMHVFDGGVSRVNFGFVALRWQSPFWRTWDWALLVLALLHGISGLRVIVQDYVKWPSARFAVNMLFYVVGFSLFTLGTVIVFTFDPSRWPGAS
jgi:succinate dehydrogenase / fumarate reductase membrane anchor subunit